MGRILIILGGVVLAILVAGVAYLAFVDVPVEPSKVDKVLPDERFPR